MEQAAPRKPKALSWMRILHGATGGGRPQEPGHSLAARPPSSAAIVRGGEDRASEFAALAGREARGVGGGHRRSCTCSCTCSAGVELNAIL